MFDLSAFLDIRSGRCFPTACGFPFSSENTYFHLRYPLDFDIVRRVNVVQLNAVLCRVMDTPVLN
jgi:hypothetical protein